jgi:hypothetical protein
MATKGDTIFELRMKLDALAQAMAELRKIGEATLPRLAAFAGVPPPTLKSIVSSGRMSERRAQSLLTKCGVPHSDPSWIDRRYTDDDRRRGGSNYKGFDTAANFRKHVRRSLGLEVETRRTLKPLQPKSLDSHIAALALSGSGQGAADDQALLVFLEIDMSPSYESEFAFGFKKVRIRIQLKEDTSLAIGARLGEGRVVHLSPAEAHLSPPESHPRPAELVARGTAYEPIWELSVAQEVLRTRYVTTDDPFFQLLSGEIGEEFDVELSAQLRDGSLSHADGTPIEQGAREAIIAILMAKRICEDPNHGWLLLGKQRLRIVRWER